MIASHRAPTDDLTPLAGLLRGRRTVVLSGAGCSTESGIPDYRGPEGSLRRRAPVQYGEFVKQEASRRRYWARSAVGWGHVAAARPNRGHTALAELERSGDVCGIITQNVDGLHQAAGSRQVIELHGSLAFVRCLGCDARLERAHFQGRLRAVNAAWLERRAAVARVAPDGDAEIDDGAYDDFVVPGCARCDGMLKPDVVFFGENVPGERVAEAWRLFEKAEVLLVVGSSLTVFSGRRFIYRAQKDGIPIAVINMGPTRADELATAKIDGRLGDVLPRLAVALGAVAVND